MSVAKFKPVESVQWITPMGQGMLLTSGVLEALVEQGAVEIKGNNCLLTEFGPPKFQVAKEKIHITISISNCEIAWKAS